MIVAVVAEVSDVVARCRLVVIGAVVFVAVALAVTRVATVPKLDADPKSKLSRNAWRTKTRRCCPCRVMITLKVYTSYSCHNVRLIVDVVEKKSYSTGAAWIDVVASTVCVVGFRCANDFSVRSFCVGLCLLACFFRLACL